MTATSDPHAVLGLQPGASQAEIKRAYRRLAKTLHPDSAGERSLPAFLAVQDAYERLTGTKVRTVRPPGQGGAARGAGASGAGATGAGATGAGYAERGFREPWRADPARARAAREQARTRRAAPGGDRPGGSSAAGATSAGANSAAPGARTSWAGGAGGTPPAGSSAGPNAEPSRPRTGTGASAGSGPDAPGRRRRSTRKATMGSTSYDEARDASDPRWAGASWYGPTTGEYWIVNPREYADPRKHGPGYSSRVRSGETHPPDDAFEGPDAGDVSRDQADSPPGQAGRPAEAAPPAEAARAAWAARRGQAAFRNAGTSTTRPTSASHPEAGQPTGSASGRFTSARDFAGPGSSPTTTPEPFLGSLIRASSNDPLRRLGLVLLAWAPPGVAAAAVIGQITGCGTYSVTCDGTDPFLPWLAQAVIIGLLLLAPPLARLFAAGAIGLLIGLVPATAGVIALGGAGSSAAPPVLSAVLAIAWLTGIAWGLRQLLDPAEPSGRGA